MYSIFSWQSSAAIRLSLCIIAASPRFLRTIPSLTYNSLFELCSIQPRLRGILRLVSCAKAFSFFTAMPYTRLASNAVRNMVICNRQAQASLSIGTLTAMLLGYKRPSYLRSMERLSADDETIKLLDSSIPNVKAYISNYI